MSSTSRFERFLADKIKARRHKTGNSTNIIDFETLLPEYDVTCERLKFRNWDELDGVYIVGVNEYENDNGNRGGWHWVVVIKNDDKFLILDPDEEECIHWGDVWKEKKYGYMARENCQIIKCNTIFPKSIKI